MQYAVELYYDKETEDRMFTDTKTIFVSPIMNSSMYQLQKDLHEHLKEIVLKLCEIDESAFF